jgi:hypothetical protein
MPTSTLIVRRLAVLGVAKPSTQLLSAIEQELAPRVAALVARSVTKPLVARCFASTLCDASAKGSPEGSGEASPALASSDLGDKPNHVAGTTADTTPGPEAQ